MLPAKTLYMLESFPMMMFHPPVQFRHKIFDYLVIADVIKVIVCVLPFAIRVRPHADKVRRLFLREALGQPPFLEHSFRLFVLL